jgi:hypothetical protein
MQPPPHPLPFRPDSVQHGPVPLTGLCEPIAPIVGPHSEPWKLSDADIMTDFMAIGFPMEELLRSPAKSELRPVSAKSEISPVMPAPQRGWAGPVGGPVQVNMPELARQPSHSKNAVPSHVAKVEWPEMAQGSPPGRSSMQGSSSSFDRPPQLPTLGRPPNKMPAPPQHLVPYMGSSSQPAKTSSRPVHPGMPKGSPGATQGSSSSMQHRHPPGASSHQRPPQGTEQGRSQQQTIQMHLLQQGSSRELNYNSQGQPAPSRMSTIPPARPTSGNNTGYPDLPQGHRLAMLPPKGPAQGKPPSSYQGFVVPGGDPRPPQVFGKSNGDQRSFTMPAVSVESRSKPQGSHGKPGEQKPMFSLQSLGQAQQRPQNGIGGSPPSRSIPLPKAPSQTGQQQQQRQHSQTSPSFGMTSNLSFGSPPQQNRLPPLAMAHMQPRSGTATFLPFPGRPNLNTNPPATAPSPSAVASLASSSASKQ